MPAFAPPSDLDLDLPGLSAAAEPWFARLNVSDQRVQAAPDARTIRYYQTAGLLDRPSRYDGRTARYGQRHLLQLVAIRALQSNGLSLAQVQAMLSGATLGELQQVIAGAMGEDTPMIAPTVVYEEPAAGIPTPFTPTTLTAVELAPGVVVTIDSRVHPDFARTIAVLRAALMRANTNAVDACPGELS